MSAVAKTQPSARTRIVDASDDVPKKEPRASRKRKQQAVSNPYPKMFGYSP
jgi:hypothetical protein